MARGFVAWITILQFGGVGFLLGWSSYFANVDSPEDLNTLASKLFYLVGAPLIGMTIGLVVAYWQDCRYVRICEARNVEP